MIRLNFVLFIALLASALYLVTIEYQSRKLATQIEHAKAAENRLELDLERLQLERRQQATTARIAHIATEQLNMRTATPATTHYVDTAGAPILADSIAPAAIVAASPRPARQTAGRVR